MVELMTVARQNTFHWNSDRIVIDKTLHMRKLDSRIEHNSSHTRSRKSFWTPLRLKREDWAISAQAWQHQSICLSWSIRAYNYARIDSKSILWGHIYCYMQIYNSGNILDDLRRSIIIELPKKPSVNECEPHRILSLNTWIMMNRSRSGITREIRQEDCWSLKSL